MKTVYFLSIIILSFIQKDNQRNLFLENQEMIAFLNYNLEPEISKGNQVFLMDSFLIERSRNLIQNYAKIHLGFCDQIELESFDFEELKEKLVFNPEVEKMILKNSKLRLVNSQENQIDTLRFVQISQPTVIDYGDFKIGSVIKKSYFIKEVNKLKWFQADYNLNLALWIEDKWDCRISIDLN